MRIQLKATMAGPAGVHRSGEVLEMDDGAAQSLVDAGYAVVVPETAAESRIRRERSEPEVAAVEPSERAVKPKPRRKRRRIANPAGSNQAKSNPAGSAKK